MVGIVVEHDRPHAECGHLSRRNKKQNKRTTRNLLIYTFFCLNTAMDQITEKYKFDLPGIRIASKRANKTRIRMSTRSFALLCKTSISIVRI
jgi:hypothetical protein